MILNIMVLELEVIVIEYTIDGNFKTIPVYRARIEQGSIRGSEIWKIHYGQTCKTV